MIDTPLIEKARAIAIDAHAGKFRRDGKTPYICHCFAVRQNVVKRVKVDNELYQIVALLHDVIEDTDVEAQQLLSLGVPADAVVAVEILTKQDGQNYDEYLQNVKRNPIAKQVKIADMLANLADNPTDKQIVKYSKGLQYLVATV